MNMSKYHCQLNGTHLNAVLKLAIACLLQTLLLMSKLNSVKYQEASSNINKQQKHHGTTVMCFYVFILFQTA